ncbi:hypothetical protein LJB77_01585 [Ruminococcaceae bacterium OttesenSCG-928-N02]|nr:hypothetical protein [Ruminococcaceae bacterium OttesenSCG-928-N02]
MQFFYGTGNQAKLQHMRGMLASLPIEIVGIHSALDTIPEINESGNDPLENAVIKATSYFNVLHAPVFSCDSGLFIEGLEDSLQPGVHVRNINGKHLTDDEMLEYYSDIAKNLGGTCRARYRNAICLVLDDCHIYEHVGDDISGEPFIISSVPHSKRREGFPLDSLSIHIDSMKYYFDLKQQRLSSASSGFLHFFQKVLCDLNYL